MNGFFEDERIRSKNRVHNEAYSLLETFRTSGLTNSETIQNAELALTTTTDKFRINVLNEIIRLVRSSNEGVKDP